jgi:hypothetical protein
LVGFSKMYKIVHLGKMCNFVHLENVRTIFTISYIGSVHLEEMYNFVQLAKMGMAAKMYTVFVTYMLVKYFYLAHHCQKYLSAKYSPSQPTPTPPTPQHPLHYTPHIHLPPPPPTSPPPPLTATTKNDVHKQGIQQ